MVGEAVVHIAVKVKENIRVTEVVFLESALYSVFGKCNTVDNCRTFTSLDIGIGVECTEVITSEYDTCVVKHKNFLCIVVALDNVGNMYNVIDCLVLTCGYCICKEGCHFGTSDVTCQAVELVFLHNTVGNSIFYVHIVPVAALNCRNFLAVVACVYTGSHCDTLSNGNIAVGAEYGVVRTVHKAKLVCGSNFLCIPCT